MAISHSIAGDVLKELGKVTDLHKNLPESASLAALKSPDIPSILVETGFISNPKEESLLKSSSHQERLAKAIHTGVLRYFETNPPSDSLIASRANSQHKVSRGESLSVIAAQYGISVISLKQANNLKSDTLRVGQKLVIPKG